MICMSIEKKNEPEFTASKSYPSTSEGKLKAIVDPYRVPGSSK